MQVKKRSRVNDSGKRIRDTARKRRKIVNESEHETEARLQYNRKNILISDYYCHQYQDTLSLWTTGTHDREGRT